MRNKDEIKTVIAENSVIFKGGLSSVLKRFSKYTFQINEISNPDALTLFLRLHTPDLLIINPLFMPGLNISTMKKDYPSLKIMAMTSYFVDAKVLSDYDSAISVYDDVDAICGKIDELFYEPDDDSQEAEQLSSREKEIIGYVVKGLTNKAIAEALSISIHTVTTHRRNISRKLQIHSSAGLAIYAIVNKIVEIQDIKDGIS